MSSFCWRFLCICQSDNKMNANIKNMKKKKYYCGHILQTPHEFCFFRSFEKKSDPTCNEIWSYTDTAIKLKWVKRLGSLPGEKNRCGLFTFGQQVGGLHFQYASTILQYILKCYAFDVYKSVQSFIKCVCSSSSVNVLSFISSIWGFDVFLLLI